MRPSAPELNPTSTAGKAKVQEALNKYKHELKKKKQFQPFDQIDQITKINAQNATI